MCAGASERKKKNKNSKAEKKKDDGELITIFASYFTISKQSDEDSAKEREKRP